MFQEFEFEIVVQPWHKNAKPNYLSRIQTREEPSSIDDNLLDAHLFKFKAIPDELADIVQFLQDGKAPEGLSEKRKKILAIKATPYTLINGSLYKLGQDDVLRRCVLPHER